MRDFEYETFREDKKHTEVAFPYNTYLCSIPLDFSSVPVHWHEEMEFIVVKKGRGLVTLDRESRLLEAGQAVIVLPGQLHGIRQYQQERMEYENIIFRLEMLLPKEGDAGRNFWSPTGTGSSSILPGSMVPLFIMKRCWSASGKWTSSQSSAPGAILWR